MNDKKKITSKNGKLEQLSKWQCIVNKKHPLLSQVAVNILAGIIAGLIVTVWVANNIPPNPKAEVVPISKSISQLKIKNLGYFPASVEYKVVSGDTAVSPSFDIEEGEKYIRLEATKQKNVKRAIIENLPKNKTIQVNVSGSNNITIINK